MAEDGSAIDALDALLTEEGVPPAAAASGATPGEMSGDSQKLKNYADLMKKVPLLRSLTEEEQLKIAALLKPKEFEDGENIIKQGEEGDCMYFIQSGEVSPEPRAAEAARVLRPLRSRDAELPECGARPRRIGISTKAAATLASPGCAAASYGEGLSWRPNAFSNSRPLGRSLPRPPLSLTVPPLFAQQAEAVVDGVGVVMEYGFGGFFGELALRTSAPRAATVRAKVSHAHEPRHD
jgi:CRP-like cAMP-binding protein